MSQAGILALATQSFLDASKRQVYRALTRLPPSPSAEPIANGSFSLSPAASYIWRRWSNPIATALGGILTGSIVTGLLGDDLKRRLQAWFQRHEARQRLYDDLGAYLGRVEALSLLHNLDLLLWDEVISPQAPNFDYYTAHEPGVLLRADKNRGVYRLVERLRGLGAAYRRRNPVLPTGGTDDNLPRSFLGDVLCRYEELLGDGLLDRRLLAKACKSRRQVIARDREPLLSLK